MAFFEENDNGWILRIKLAPGASFNGFKGTFKDENNVEYLKAYVTTVPEKGKANKELIKLLAKSLNTAKSCINLISGETEHLKKLHINMSVSAENAERLASLQKD